MRKRNIFRHLPKAIVIRKKLYEIRYVKVLDDEDGDPLCGECTFPDRVIKISLTNTREEMESTLIHEIIHCIAYEYGFNLREKKVLKIEKGLYSILKSNRIKLMN